MKEIEKRRRQWNEQEKEIWTAYRPMLVFPPDRETSTFLELREQVWKLTSRGCDLAFLLSTANSYATFRLLEDLSRESRSAESQSKLEKIRGRLRSLGDQSVKLAEELALVLDRRAAEVVRLRLVDHDAMTRFVKTVGLARILRELCNVAQQPFPENRPDELRAWRRAELNRLVNHVRGQGIKHFWRPLAALVSCCQPRGVRVEYLDEAPYFSLSQDPQPLRRTAEQLRQEHLNMTHPK